MTEKIGSEQDTEAAPACTDVGEIVASLQITSPASVLLLAGSPGSMTDGIRAAVRAAADGTGAVVLDATSSAGDDAPHWNGSAAERIAHVVPADTGRDDPHRLASLGQAVAHGMPMALLLVGGDDTALAQATGALERGGEIFVAAGSGGAADLIATAMRARRDVGPAAAAFVAGVHHVHVVVVGTDPEAGLSRELTWVLHRDRVLKDAWHLFTTFDRAAVRLRTSFERFQIAILLVGLLATLVALLAKQLGTANLRWLVAAASITLAGLTALSGRRAAGKRWIVTRAAAEEVKSEIFRYRTHTGRYADGRLPGRDPARRSQLLAVRLGEIEGRLMHTEVGNSALLGDDRFGPPVGSRPGDDGLSPLTAEDYVVGRINDQLHYYHARLRAYDRRRQVLQGLAVLASGAGALVAAVGGQMWVALTSVVAAAPLAYLAHLQVEKTIVTYNQSVAQLDDVLRRWHGRASHAPSRQAFSRLVDATEAILTAEHGAWVEEMTQAMHDLDNDQPDAASPDGQRK